MAIRKKLVISIIFLTFLAFSLIVLLNILSDNDKNTSSDITLPDEMFYEPDFDADILSDPEYLELNRAISYTNGAITYTISNG